MNAASEAGSMSAPADADAAGGGAAREGANDASRGSEASAREGAGGASGENIVVKVALLGDSGVGKTSLMVRYVEKRFDEDHTATLGINFLEKVIMTSDTAVTLSLWDLGGDRAFSSMLPMACVDAVALVFLFDLTNRASLHSIREWYRQARGLNRSALTFLVGTKFDAFAELSSEEQEETTQLARRFGKAMKADGLVFCSSLLGINVLRLFKLIFEKVFGLDVDVEQRSEVGEPILEYSATAAVTGTGTGTGAGAEENEGGAS